MIAISAVLPASGLVDAATHPASLQELAERTGRKPSKYPDPEEHGTLWLVRLHRGHLGRVRPEVPYQAISLSLDLAFSA